MPSGVWCLAVEMLDLLANDEVSADLRDGGFHLASFRGVGKAGILVSTIARFFKGLPFPNHRVVFIMLNFLGVCGMNSENYFIEEQKMSQVSEEDHIELHEVFGKKIENLFENCLML